VVRGLDGLQIWFECSGKEKNPYPYWESNPGRPAYSLVTILTELPWLMNVTEQLCKYSFFIPVYLQLYFELHNFSLYM